MNSHGGARRHHPIEGERLQYCPDPVPGASNRVILVRRTLLYTLELPRLSLLKVAARIRRRRGRRREQFFTREQGPYQLTHPGTPIIRS